MSEGLINVTRGKIVENIIRGDIAVINNNGELIAACGNPYKLTYMRSAAKPLQAAAIIERGVADTFNLESDEIAIMCSSHIADHYHLKVVESVLNKIGLEEDDLQCGADYSHNAAIKEACIAKSMKKRKIYNNCSGKHASMLALCVQENWDITTYYSPEHPVQKIILDNMSYFTGVPKDSIVIGIDGCGVPVFGVPLFNMAWSYNRMLNHQNLSQEKQIAADRITNAMWQNPRLIAGDGEFCTALLQAAPQHILGKMGADGIYCCAIKDGPAIALKIEDGNGAISAMVMVSVLRQLGVLTESESTALERFSEKLNFNCRGEIVGETAPTFQLATIKLGKMEY